LVRHRTGKLAAQVMVLPKGLDVPFAGCFRYPQHHATLVIAGRDENPVLIQYQRLGNVDVLIGLPWELPELLAGLRIVACDYLAIEQENLTSASQSREHGGAVSGLGAAAGPHLSAGRALVGDHGLAGGRVALGPRVDDHE